MQQLFQVTLYQPIFNGFVALYNLIPDVGIDILIITILIKLVLYPLTTKSIQAQKSLQVLQPKMDALKKQYKKNDQQKLAKETMKLYKDNKVSPFGSCLPLLIQLPIFLALYWVLQAGLTTDNFGILYSFVHNPGHLNPITLGLFDLSKKGNVILALLAGASQYWQTKMLSTKQPPKAAGKGGKDESMMAMMNKQMLYFMPVMTILIGFELPAGLALYWFLSTLTTALQQVIIFHQQKKKNKSNSSSSDIVETIAIDDKK